MLCRQKAVAEQPDTTVRCDRFAALQDNVTGQVFVFAAQSISAPSTSTRMPHEWKPAVHKEISLRVLVHWRGHRTDHRKFVRHRSQFGKHITDFQSTLTPFIELERAGHHRTVVVELRPLDRHRHRFAVEFFQLRFWIKRIDVRNTAGHEAKDHMLGFGLMVSRFGFCVGSRHHRRKRDRPETSRAVLQHASS